MATAQCSTDYFSLHDTDVEVCWDDRSVGRAVRAILEHFGLTRRKTTPAERHVELSFCTRGPLLSLPERAQRIVRRQGIAVWRADPFFYVAEGRSIMQLDIDAGSGKGLLRSVPWPPPPRICMARVNLVLHSLLILLRGRSVYPLHGAALVKGGAGLLLVGASDSGKSTQALSLVREGWKYLTDDSLALRPADRYIEALSLRRDFGLDRGAVHTFPEVDGHQRPVLTEKGKQRIDVDAMYPGQRAPRCTPRALIFPTIVSRPESELRSIGGTDALCRLMRQSILLSLNPRIAKEHLDVLQRLVEQVQSYELLAGRDLKQNPSRVARLLGPTLSGIGQNVRAQVED